VFVCVREFACVYARMRVCACANARMKALRPVGGYYSGVSIHPLPAHDLVPHPSCTESEVLMSGCTWRCLCHLAGGWALPCLCACNTRNTLSSSAALHS